VAVGILVIVPLLLAGDRLKIFKGSKTAAKQQVRSFLPNKHPE